MIHYRALSLIAILSLAAPAAAQDKAPPPPAALLKVTGCRALTDDRQRLACFDASVAELDAARGRGDVVAFDRAEVKKTRKRLFGFSLSGLSIFGVGRDGDAGGTDREEIEELVATIRAVTRGADGWIVTLEDGARWEQTDGKTLGRSPKPGMTATIKRAALGSYKMSFDGGQTVKARRIG